MSGRGGSEGASTAVVPRNRGKRRKDRKRQPYTWLGTGAVTLGVGAVLIQGVGIAHADGGSSGAKSGQGGASAPDHAAAKKPPSKKAGQPPADDGTATAGDSTPADAPVSTPKKTTHQTNSDTAHQNSVNTHSAAAKVADAPAAVPAHPAPPRSAPVAAVSVAAPVTAKRDDAMAQPVSAVVVQPSGGSGVAGSGVAGSAAQVGAAGAPAASKAVAATGTGAPSAPLTVAPLALLMGSAYSQSNSSGSSTAAPAGVVTTGAPPASGASPVVATIPVDPYAIAITRDGKTLYGTNSPYATDANGLPIGTVEVVSTATNAQVGSPITVGSFIGDGNIAVNPTMDRAYVTAYNQVTLTSPGGVIGTTYAPSLVVIDTSTNKVVGNPIVLATFDQNGIPTTQFSPGPTGSLAVSPDGSRVYLAGTVVTSTGGTAQLQAAVAVFDTSTNTQIGSPIMLGAASSNPYSVSGGESVLVSPTGNRLYVTVTSAQYSGNVSQPAFTSTIYTVDSRSGAVVGNPIVLPDDAISVIPGTNEILSPDGTKIYVESLPYSVLVSSVSSNQVPSAQQVANATVQTFDTGTGQQVGAPINVVGFGAMSISNDGKTLYVADIADSRTGKTAVFQTTSTTPGQAIYLGSISAYNLVTGKTVGSPTTVGLYPTSLAINSAGNRLYVANMGDNTISVIDITGGSNGNLTPIAKIIQTVTAAVQRAAIQVQTVFTNVLNAVIHVQQQVVTQVQQIAMSAQNVAEQVQKQVAAQVQQAVKAVTSVVTSLVNTVVNIVNPPSSSTPFNPTASGLYSTIVTKGNQYRTDTITVQLIKDSKNNYRMVVSMTGIGGSAGSMADGLQGNLGTLLPYVRTTIDSWYDYWNPKHKIQGIMLVGLSGGGEQMQDYAADGAHGNLVKDIVLFGAPLVKKVSQFPSNPKALLIVDGSDHTYRFWTHHDAQQSYLDSPTDDVYETGKYTPMPTIYIPGLDSTDSHNQGTYVTDASNFDKYVAKNPGTVAAQNAKDWQNFKGTVVDSYSFQAHT